MLRTACDPVVDIGKGLGGVEEIGRRRKLVDSLAAVRKESHSLVVCG